MTTPSRADLLNLLRLLEDAGLAMRVPDDDAVLEHVAHHEAGHAMVGRALGGSVESISIADERRTSRIAHLDHDEIGLREFERVERVEVIAKTLLGGPVAEQRCAGASRGWGGDLPSLASLLMSNPHPTKAGPAWLHELVNATESLVSECWGDIETIARALLDRGSLARFEIVEVLRRRPRPH